MTFPSVGHFFAGIARAEPDIVERAGIEPFQLPALAAAGYRAIAVDQRGYGLTSVPADVGAYHVDELIADILGLLDVLEIETELLLDWYLPAVGVAVSDVIRDAFRNAWRPLLDEMANNAETHWVLRDFHSPNLLVLEAGTTALLKFDLDMSSREFCVALLKETGVMFTPGSALGMEGCVRIGYANGPEVLKTGLARVSEFLHARGG